MSKIFGLGGSPGWNAGGIRRMHKPYWSELCQISQYTGVKTRDGEKIFEGDIVEWVTPGQQAKAVIRYDENRAAFYEEYFYNSTGGGCEGIQNHLITFQIIGNIFDNPELLKGNYESCVQGKS